MNRANILAIGVFFGFFMSGMLVLALRDMLRGRSPPLVSKRLAQVTARLNVAQTRRVLDETWDLFQSRQDRGLVRNWLEARILRIRTVSGQTGVRVLFGSFIFGVLLALASVRIVAMPLWLVPLVLIGTPALLARVVYQRLIGRFRTRFLNAFPNTIDLIVRAVRAGIPAVQAISVAGNDADEPVRSEFRLIGDRLRLGADLQDVLDKAVERIQIADFSFFSVCLLLQRETGGALTETLENLANIIRARVDIRLKIVALTGEGRITSKIIAAVPFFILGFMYLTNADYVAILFNTAAGRKLMMIAAGLLFVGMVLINKIANLDTSR